MAKHSKGSLVSKITSWQVILGIQAIASLLLIGLVFKLNALPLLYTMVLIGIVVLLALITFLLMKPSKIQGQGKIRNIIGKVISLLLSVFLMLGSLYIAQGNSVIDAISSANTKTTRISLVVMADSDYQKVSDLKNQTIEANLDDEDNAKYMNEAIEALNKEESTIQVNNASSYVDMANDLYSGETKAIYINEANYGMLEEEHDTFRNDTRIIWSYDIVEQTKDISKNVNVTKEVFTIFISGIDTTGPVSTVSRSDVNMLVTVNPETKQILMTSIPRDYYVTLTNKGKKDKLTHAGLGGVENSVSTIENFMGIDINYYARVNFTSLIEMVDALGGITVYSPVAFTTLHGGYQIHKGNNEMDGDKALGFVRERYGLSGGDNDRVKNQQRVLTGMLKKAMSPAILTNYSSVLSSIEGSFETNMSAGEITDLIKMQLNDMASWDIYQIQLTGNGQMMTGGAYMPNNRLYYMIPNENSVNECASLIKQMMNGEKISVEQSE